MTGLPNRIAFNERLAFDAAEAHEKAHKLAAFSIDVDGFKDINDVFGHSAGDLLLIEVAEPDARGARPGEFLARQSGDEFLGLQMSGNHPHDAQAFRRTHRAACSRSRFDLGEQPVTLTASIGYLGVSDRHAGARPGAEQRQACDVSRQDQATRLDQHVSARDGRQCPRAARARARSAKCGRAQRAGAALPAADFAGGRKDLRRRSADALAPSKARHDFAGGIHSAGGGNRGDRSDGRMGVAHRLSRRRRRPDSRNGRGQPVAGSVQPRRSCGNHPHDPAGDRPVAETSRGRGHGIDGHVGPDPRPAYPAQAEGDGHFGGDGRFRHRLFVAGDAACVSRSTRSSSTSRS